MSAPIEPDSVQRCSVRVPGSTSNLGPGFDFAGLALSIYLDARVEGAAHGVAHELVDLRGTAADWPRERDNVFLRAFDHGCATFGVRARALRFSIDSQIPLARGIGSSGAAIAAGLLLARAQVRPRARASDTASSDTALIEHALIEHALIEDTWIEDATLCDLAFAIEGHPDNTSASILGGCTLSIPRDDGTLRVVRQALHRDLGFVVAWPDAQLSTRAGRAVLPREVPFADAVENPRRLAALLEGLRTGDPELLELGSHDRLHVRHRLALIENGERALAAARESGAWLATVSGSGSALFAIGPHARTNAIAAALQRELGRGPCGGDGAQGRVVTPVDGTPLVRID